MTTTPEKTSIVVRYKSDDGWHVFYSDELPGLYVANADAQKALRAVVPAIEKLIELDDGVKVRVEIEPPLEMFLEMLKRNSAAERQRKIQEFLQQKGAIPPEQRYSVYAEK